MSNVSFEIATHEGRQICDSKELKGAYCGSVSLSVHCAQLNNKGSWVHNSTDRWLYAYAEEVFKVEIAAINEKAKKRS